MNPLFVQNISLKGRLTLALVLAFLLIFLDNRLGAMQEVRLVLNSLVSPVQYIARMPEQALQGLYGAMRTRSSLHEENRALRDEVLDLQGAMQRYDFLSSENRRLRNLLGSDAQAESLRMVAEVIAVDSDPFSQQVVINKGTLHGAFIGQPVIDDRGIIGQIASIGLTTARIILISDQGHGLPTRSDRSGIRVVAQGVGETERLELMHVPHSTELEVGDLLVTSGLGGLFPEGYPVARITEIIRDESLPFAQVSAEPASNLDRIRMVLLLWQPDSDRQPIFNPLSRGQNREGSE
ncbi:rod shape-determining protein MreC [Aliidiomarina minuta]|uniref:Cell shape-determining protein MreC n=1 Tax=Aliidiomarina minuta TaxID=880057 RepID=A0A432W941_9GAMM|nr:rod shape-determining protein MreC [Aliidiomarina minuta]RUO26670.1 rod shape-determining protein MreC [Aliidiomarina minuta]